MAAAAAASRHEEDRAAAMGMGLDAAPLVSYASLEPCGLLAKPAGKA